MLLAVVNKDGDISLLIPDKQMTPGDRIQ